jgi:hypothetical protein
MLIDRCYSNTKNTLIIVINRRHRGGHSRQPLNEEVIGWRQVVLFQHAYLCGGHYIAELFLQKPSPEDELCDRTMLNDPEIMIIDRSSIQQYLSLTSNQVCRVSAESTIPNPALMSLKDLFCLEFEIR